MRTLWGFFKKKPYFVPFAENNDAGVRVPWSLIGKAGKNRLIYKSVDYQSYSYKRWQAHPPRIRISEGHIHVPRGLRRLIYNPSGLFEAYLRGEIRRGTITVRTNGSLPYDAKRAVTPYWDYQHTTVESEIYGSDIDKALWDIVTTENIGHLMCSFT
jgi:hypothetical protein